MTPNKVSNIHEFENSTIKLSYLKERDTELNMLQLKHLNEPIATIKARHILLMPVD